MHCEVGGIFLPQAETFRSAFYETGQHRFAAKGRVKREHRSRGRGNKLHQPAPPPKKGGRLVLMRGAESVIPAEPVRQEGRGEWLGPLQTSSVLFGDISVHGLFGAVDGRSFTRGPGTVRGSRASGHRQGLSCLKRRGLMARSARGWNGR
ncbi:unnamed protein product [Calypogeia fissa]